MSLYAQLVLLALMLVTLPVSAEALEKILQPFTAHYQGRANGLAVNDLGVRELKALGNNQFQLQYRAEAMIYSLEETSIFRIEKNVIQPLSYRSNRGSFLHRREASLDFDWTTNKGAFDYKGKSGSFPLQPNTQDPLSGSLELARLLAPEKTRIKYQEAEKKGIGSTELVVIDQPMLKTALGELKTWHLERIHRDPKRKTEVWLHFEFPTVPVKVHQTVDGDEFQLDITRFELK